MCECGDGREYPFGCTSVYQDCHSCGAKCKVIEIDTEEGEEELLSNCCGASIDGLNADNIGICSECKEGCTVEGMDVAIYENKEVLRKYKDKEASHMFGAIQGAFKPEPEDSLIKGVHRKKNKKECKEGCGVEEVGEIEKIPPVEVYRNPKKKGFATLESVSTSFEVVVDKINEIIDKLNEQKQ